MNKIYHLILVLTFIFNIQTITSQVSQGGDPLPFPLFRSASISLFTEMEGFDLKAMLKEDSLVAKKQRSNRFAKKFLTDLNPNNSGIRFTTADGTRVWQCGIRSKGAYSINLLFTQYHLPEGAKLFIFNSTRTHKIGAFTEKNNNAQNQLPTAPVYGDEVIVEYQEPANAKFRGQIAIGEVNHDYRGITLRARPGVLSSFETCHKDAIQFPEYQLESQAVTLLIINGTEFCTGCLLNNVEQDGTPFILTAAHCFNSSNSSITLEESRSWAQKTVVFFNYQNPSKQNTIIGTEEMSMASTDLVAKDDTTDMTLLRLKQMPPQYYRPYYAGWNAGTPAAPTYFGIHHPMSKTKKIVTSTSSINRSTFINCLPNAHWVVQRWVDGATEGGSSGSPLFDSNKRVVGFLSGGDSYCSNPINDLYSAIQVSYSYNPDPGHQLKNWLDPLNRGSLTTNGYNPYPDSTCSRISNVLDTEKTGVSYLNSGSSEAVFSSNSTNSTEFAERFITRKKTKIYGVHLVTPNWLSQWNSKVTISIYKGYVKPDQLVSSFDLQLSYLSYNGGFGNVNIPNTRANDNFIKLPSPVNIDYCFFVSYKIQNSSIDTFKVFNVLDRATTENTAYVKTQTLGWLPATDLASGALFTSLWIDPIVFLGKDISNPYSSITPDTIENVQINYDSSTHSIRIKGIYNDENFRLKMYDLSGKLVLDQGIDIDSYIPIDSNINGIYLVNLLGLKKSYRQKIAIYQQYNHRFFYK